jgi:beta-xylosidase
VSAAPVHPGDFPDPFVFVAGARYYAVATNGRGSNVQLMSSPDLVGWTRHADALAVLPPWVEPGHTWSPSVLARGDRFALFYAARYRRWGRQAISVATADRPEGPYVDRSRQPFIFQRRFGGSIDPSPFVDVDDQPYLLWKADANAVGRRPSLWGQRLAADGTSLVGSPTRLLVRDCPWEDPLIEAPSIVRSAGICYLFYSANWWMSENYGIGYATAPDPLGRYVKVTTSGPWFGSDAAVAGPGGQEFFVDATGRLRMAYHGWQPGAAGYPHGARTLRIAEVSFDGVPTVR